VFTDDADFIDIRGSHHHGRTEIGKGHQAIFDTIYKDQTSSTPWCPPHPSVTTPSSASLPPPLDTPGGPLQGVKDSRISVVVVNNAATGWRVRLVSQHDRDCLYDPAAEEQRDVPEA
jgi:hypothetical protein